ncbi:GCN5 family acetyltransferase [Sphingobium sp. Leaf26]|uniref:GNAT family N-acetyltransferase n=1 Tax=Sphingobium sp. Leaf26 TaxID=1735693 RepID=UPI0006F86FD0|nr:GNAT family N-acetyltransferase [Sphingobium sp. Leaf26]KQM97029.1 GCN5 family acetyltransferase [Sphingobium sp. Leaf26]
MSDWRPMVAADIPAVAAISDAVHGDYTEQAAVYVERLQLYPAGCWLLERDGQAIGYLISHPWAGRRPPPLNRPIQALPEPADHYYLHDLALLPDARGSGAAQAAIGIVQDQARRAGYVRIALTAVNGADAFWTRNGFTALTDAEPYGSDSLAMEQWL